MQFDAILEVVIGLIFVWLVVSVATLEVQNRVAEILNWRADHLEQSILGMFKDPQLVDKFYNHPLVRELSLRTKSGEPKTGGTGKLRRPGYIPERVFATAAFEVIMNAGREGEDVPVDEMSIVEMQASLNALKGKNPTLAKMTHYLYPNMERDIAQLDEKIAEYRKSTEAWFNDVMTQTSNLYKLRAQWVSFLIGLIIAAVLNMDSINIAQTLWREPTLRASIVAQAEAQAQSGITDLNTTASTLTLPLGWNPQNMPSDVGGWLIKAFGFLLSGAAAAQGAPFWFDALRKLVGFKSQTEKDAKSD